VRPLIVDLGRDYRGGQHQALLLLQGLLARGHAPELMALSDSLLVSRAREVGASVYAVDPGWRRLVAASQIRKLVGEKRIAIVHANEPHALTSAWLARSHRTVPIVAARRIALPLSRSPFSLARYRAAARIVAVSHFVERSVVESGIPADRVSVIYDGLRIPPEISQTQRDSSRKQLGVPPGIPCIGNVAAFVPEKGHALLLHAFAKLRARIPECVLLLRGEGPELTTLQSLARELRVAEAVKFLPRAVEIETMFAAMDVFAFPSHEEPLGSALLAAMAHALPVVAIARGGVPEVVEEGKNGLLVKDLNREALFATIASLVDHPDEAKRLGKAARESAIDYFSVDRMVERTIQLYEGQIATHPAAKSKTDR
jgi:glycosyltransferase involved in cell wall biosynthesis